jgi:hypothetical protein
VSASEVRGLRIRMRKRRPLACVYLPRIPASAYACAWLQMQALTLQIFWGGGASGAGVGAAGSTGPSGAGVGVGASVGREERSSKSSNQSVPPFKAAARSKIDVQDHEGEEAGGGEGEGGRGGEEMCGKWREGVSVGTKVLDKSGVVRQVRLGVCLAPFEHL